MKAAGVAAGGAVLAACAPQVIVPSASVVPTPIPTDILAEAITSTPTEIPETVTAAETMAKFDESKAFAIEENGHLVVKYKHPANKDKDAYPTFVLNTDESGVFDQFTLHPNGSVTLSTENGEVRMDPASIKLDGLFNGSRGKIYTHDVRMRMTDKQGNLWEFHNGKFAQVDFELTINFEEENSIPSIDIKTMTSADFYNSCKESLNSRSMKHSDTSKPFSGFKLLPDSNNMRGRKGYQPIMSVNKNDSPNYVKKPENLPITPVGIWKITDFSDSQLFFVLAKWDNPIDSFGNKPEDGLIGYILVKPEEGSDVAKSRKGNLSLSYGMNDMGIIANGYGIPTPIMSYNDGPDRNGFEKYLSFYRTKVDLNLVKWLYEIQSKFPFKNFKRASNDGVLLNDANQGELPIYFAPVIRVDAHGEI